MKTFTIGNKYTKMLCISLILCWMVLIFLMSAQVSDDSNASSGTIVKFVADVINIDEGTAAYNILTYIVRKCAHMFEYAVLGILIVILMHHYTLSTLRRIGFSGLGCILYAATDEVHQYFVPGRACRFTDVIIDMLGSAAGILVMVLIIRVFKMRKEKKRIYSET